MTSFQRSPSARRLLSAPLAIGIFLSVTGCGGGGSSGGGGGAPPTVNSVSPAQGAVGVPTNTRLNVAFSSAMDIYSFDTTNFRLTGPGSTPVAGAVESVDQAGNVTFEPVSDLATDTLFTATVSEGVRDLAGNALATDFVWTFTTGVTTDTTQPLVTVTSPDDGATGVATNSKLAATFNEAMDPATLTQTTFTLTQGASTTGQVSYSDSAETAVFAPDQPLLPGTVYTARLSTSVKDLAGNALSVAHVWSFTTGTGQDTSPPTVASTNPDDLDVDVARNKRVNATFSADMDPTTISTLTYRLTGPNDVTVSGTVSYDTPSRVGTFAPTADLASNTQYTATVTTGAKDLAGNSLVIDEVWTFMTGGNNATQGPLPVNLGSAANFAVLAGAAVTNTGPTEIFGNVGLHPGSSVGGFPPGIVHGLFEVGTPTALAAKGDLTVAYNDAQGRVDPILLANGNLGGLTLTPGVYTFATNLQLSGTGPQAILTLDAQGDATAVWIFQCKAGFDATSGTSIVLSGGAKAANVYWAVASTASFGTTVSFVGTVMAEASVTLATGATLNGRALASSANVTLDSNTITLPSR